MAVKTWTGGRGLSMPETVCVRIDAFAWFRFRAFRPRVCSIMYYIYIQSRGMV